MNLKTYLEAKYAPLKTVCINRDECRAFGVSAALKSGWYERHKNSVMTKGSKEVLITATKKRVAKGEEYAKKALSILQEGMSEEEILTGWKNLEEMDYLNCLTSTLEKCGGEMNIETMIKYGKFIANVVKARNQITN